MSPEYSLCSQSKVYVLKSTVYVHRVQLMVPEYSLCPQSTVFQFQEYTLCSQSTVDVPRVLFKSSGSSLCP